jgi:hypothetical protein
MGNRSGNYGVHEMSKFVHALLVSSGGAFGVWVGHGTSLEMAFIFSGILIGYANCYFMWGIEK